MAVLKIRDENGNVIEIPSLPGAKGEGVPEVTKGDDGKLLQVVDGEWAPAGASGTTNFADNGLALGQDTVAGVMAYYYKAIDHVNKKIYLSNIQVEPVVTTEDLTDTTFDTPAYTVGKKFSLVNGAHWDLIATIVSIQNNVVTYDVELPSKKITAGGSDIDDYTFFVPTQPEVGVVAISANCAAFGNGNKATNSGAFAAGKDNVVAGDNAAAFGRQNTVGYCSFAAGRGNEVVPGKGSGYGFAAGYKNKVTGGNAAVFGVQNEVSGGGAFGCGSGVKSLGNCTFAGGVRTTAVENGAACFGWSDVAAPVEDVNAACRNYYHTDENGNVISTVGSKYSGVSAAMEDGSFVCGINNVAIGLGAFAGGYETLASGDYAFAEGEETLARNRGAHAAGHKTRADWPYSYAGGTGTYTRRSNQHVVGEWNIPRNDALYIVGNGTDEENRSNAFEVWQDGSADIYTQGTRDTSVVTVKYLMDIVAELRAEIAQLKNT